MKNLLTRPLFHVALLATSVGGILAWSGQHSAVEASSHREAPLIADDPLADNTDLYAFRSPDSPTNNASASVTLIASYIPFELPQGGPNFNTFGENIRYEIHIKNRPVVARFPGDVTSPGDDIIYRFTFTRENQDPTTFFRIRLGQENMKTTYMLEAIRGGATTVLIPAGQGIVAPPNVGPRTISARVTVPGVGTNVPAGLGAANYAAVMNAAVQTLGNGIRVFCGPTDDPFFTDLGAIFDLGGVRPRQVQGGAVGANAGTARDGLARKNVHTIAMQIPVRLLQATGQDLTAATSILDPNFVIGVWANASRQTITTRTTAAPFQVASGGFVQVSRIGMPLTNEVVQNLGAKDLWNAESSIGAVPLPVAGSPQFQFDAKVMNPELGLYMADNAPVNAAAPKPAGQTYFGEAIGGLAPLRIQSKSLAGTAGLPAGGFDFRNGANGLAGLVGNPALAGTALAPLAQGGFGEYLLRPQSAPGMGQPRSVDLLPIFHTGVPNARPYQLATGKGGNPLAAGKPFINNFLPTFSDMLRLNMAVPPTDRNSTAFSSQGLLAAAVAGLTNPAFAGTTLQLIPNMDGFPNGRRLEDDVTRIELQAVGGVVLAAIGLWYDDYPAGGANPVTTQLGNVLNFSTNIERNDTTFRVAFPYAQLAWSGTTAQQANPLAQRSSGLGMSPNLAVAQAYPNPFVASTTFHFEMKIASKMTLIVHDVTGRKVATVAKDKAFVVGINDVVWTPGRDVAPGQYIATLYNGSTVVQSVRIERH